MDATTWIAIACAAMAVIYWLVNGRGLRKPPGPFGLPIVGYLPFLTSKPHLKLQELRKKYGSVYSIRLGSIYVVVLNDFSSIKKAFSLDAFIGRPPESPFDLSKENIESGAFNGMPWKEQRRVCLHMLRDVGLGKTRTEDHIKEEILDLLEKFEASKGDPIKVSNLLAPSMSNNISSLVFGRRMKYDDPKRVMLDDIFKNVGELSGQVSWQLFFPTLKKIVSYLNVGSAKRLKENNNLLKVFVRDEINEHEKTLDPNNIRDFIDGYLLEIKKRENDPTFIKPVLVDLVGAFFGAGSDTVRITVDWLMLTMATFPDIQKKVQEEIDEVLGRESFPTGADRTKMPYSEAAIMEIMRWISIVPINPLRYTLNDVEINGYFIPKDTTVLANIWGVHHDPDLWGDDVDIYRPERFLAEDGKALKKIDHFIPFSTGKRACPGEGLARVEVFLYFVAILQKFDLKLPRGRLPDFDGILGIGLQPKRQPLLILKRQ